MTDTWQDRFAVDLQRHIHDHAHAAVKVSATRTVPVVCLYGREHATPRADDAAAGVRATAVRAVRDEIDEQGYMAVTALAEEWFLRDFNSGRESPARFPTWEGALTISNSGTMDVAVQVWCLAIPALPAEVVGGLTHPGWTRSPADPGAPR